VLPGTISRWAFVILLLSGSPFACVGVYEATEVQRDLSRAVSTQGTVVDNAYVAAYEGTNETGAYYPVVEFVTTAGETVRFTDRIGCLPPDYVEGAQVRVFYDPADPHAARLASWKRLWFAPTLFVAVGVLPAIVFGVWGRAARWRRRPTS
jgi:hypothetical protein